MHPRGEASSSQGSMHAHITHVHRQFRAADLFTGSSEVGENLITPKKTQTDMGRTCEALQTVTQIYTKDPEVPRQQCYPKLPQKITNKCLTFLS